MAVPDWPNSYGYNMFTFPVSMWIGGILYEHSHRLAGSVVGFLTLVLALWLNGRPAAKWLRGGGLVVLALGLMAATSPRVKLDNVPSCAARAWRALASAFSGRTTRR
jgi:heme A synthase